MSCNRYVGRRNGIPFTLRLTLNYQKKFNLVFVKGLMSGSKDQEVRWELCKFAESEFRNHSSCEPLNL